MAFVRGLVHAGPADAEAYVSAGVLRRAPDLLDRVVDEHVLHDPAAEFFQCCSDLRFAHEALGHALRQRGVEHRRVAVRYRGTLDIATFAGYCPLKNSIERLRGGTTTLDRLLGMHAQGKVAGFKLYPPMGFQATGNAGLAEAAFDPREKGRVTALDRWHSAGGKGKLGQALDASLEAFYAVCAARGIPLMAHAANSNGAGPNFGRRADHLFWKQVAARHPIRLSLGHLAGQVRPFCEAVAKGPPYPADDWALATSIELLDAGSKGAEVYGDLAYMEELIDDPQLARDFFLALRTAYGKRDPDLTRILYGTDWIMLGIERHHERYLDQVIAGMQAANYSPVQQSNILGGNLRRFLRR